MLVPGFRGVGPWRFGELSQYSDSSLLCWCRASAGWGRGVSGSFRSTVTVTVPNCAGAGLPGWGRGVSGSFRSSKLCWCRASGWGRGVSGGFRSSKLCWCRAMRLWQPISRARIEGFRGTFAIQLPNCAGASWQPVSGRFRSTMTVPTAGAGLGVVAACFARCAPGSNGFRGAFAAQWQFQIVLVPGLRGRGGADFAVLLRRGASAAHDRQFQIVLVLRAGRGAFSHAGTLMTVLASTGPCMLRLVPLAYTVLVPSAPGAGVNIDDRAYMWQKSCVALDALRPLISLLHWQGHRLCHGACVEKKKLETSAQAAGTI